RSRVHHRDLHGGLPAECLSLRPWIRNEMIKALVEQKLYGQIRDGKTNITCPDEFGFMTITRHFVTVGKRRIHYRKAGSGPPLLMVHQSPRSSAEYEPLMTKWAQHFTCIAPDTPGFGQSDPLPGDPDINDFSTALME